MRTIGALPKEVYKPSIKESGEFENRLTFGEDVKEVIDLKEVEPNNSFYDKEVSKEKEPIREVKPKAKKKK